MKVSRAAHAAPRSLNRCPDDQSYGIEDASQCHMLVLSEADLIGLLPLAQIGATKAALRARGTGQILAPKRLHLQWGTIRCGRCLPCFISVGPFNPTMQELPDSVYNWAGLIAVDSEHARYEVGDVVNPVQNGLVSETNVFCIGDCVAARRAVDPDRTTVYKSVGSATCELFVGQALYRAVKARGLGLKVDL